MRVPHARLAIVLGLLYVVSPLASAQSVWDALNSNASTNALGALGLFKNAILLSQLQSKFANTSLDVTVLAPTDAALFAALPLMGLSQDTLVQNAALMQPILLYHVFSPATTISALPVGSTTKGTLAPQPGLQITLQKTSSSSVVIRSVGSDANVNGSEIAAGSSVVIPIDTVLLPFYPTIYSALTRNPVLSELALVSAIPGLAFTKVLTNPLAEYTVLAPINFAFTAFYAGQNTSLAKLATTPGAVQQLLSYHIIPTAVLYSSNITTTPITVKTLSGQNLTLVRSGSAVVVVTPSGNATISVFDIPAGFTNQGTYRSVVHVIDKVLVPPPYASVTEALATQGVSTLVAAITAEGSYTSAVTGSSFRGTIFAPSNAAFSSALAASNMNLTQLTANLANLKKILDLHVVPNVTYTVAGLLDGQTITTFGGANSLTVDKSVAGVTRLRAAQNSANITSLEVPINNGQAVIIVIDAVLIPANVTLSPLLGSGTPGAASTALPSFMMLAWSAFAAVLLYAFHSH